MVVSMVRQTKRNDTMLLMFYLFSRRRKRKQKKRTRQKYRYNVMRQIKEKSVIA